jgi:F0F1-type ATP synthase assembly protein I
LKKSNKNPYIVFSSMAVQMGVAIGGGAWGGSLLDDYVQNDKPIWAIVFSLVGIGASLYLLIRAAKKLGEDE